MHLFDLSFAGFAASLKELGIWQQQIIYKHHFYTIELCPKYVSFPVDN